MLCEGRLWCVVFCRDSESVPTALQPQRSSTNAPPETQSPPVCFPSPARASPSGPPQPCRHLSPGLAIPGQAGETGSASGEAFLVPSSCQSICQHYSDLHIAGDQVLPLSAGRSPEPDTPGPFLLSWDVPPESLPPHPPEPGQGGVGRHSSRWRERPSLVYPAGPLSNSQLNRYLEQKLLELYRQYLAQGPPAARGSPPGPLPLLASELVQTSLDQITLQLSRGQNLERERAKDLLISCLLRVASEQQSSEISTPLLQISTDTA